MPMGAVMSRFPVMGRALVRVWVVLSLGLVIMGPVRMAPSVTECPSGSTLDVVAHEDDDLLFLNPDVLHDIASSRCVRTVYVTAADAGGPASYWQSREAGIYAAYAEMAGVANIWTTSDAGVSGHPIPVATLQGRTTVSVVFMRLPDGLMDGSGSAARGYQSLQKLWQGNVSEVTAVDGSSSYGRSALISALTAIMNSYGPDTIRTQDYVHTFGEGDHSDHYAVAAFVWAAQSAYQSVHSLVGYWGYPSSGFPENVTGEDLADKKSTFYTYGAFDEGVCASDESCAGTVFAAWLGRRYVIGSAAGGNLALAAVASASSENPADGQTANKAIDGVVDGWPDDYTREWATSGGHAGSWLRLTWSSPQPLSSIVLHDRPNLSDQVTSGRVVFSDGSAVDVGTLSNDGSPVTVTFPTRSVTSLEFDILGVSDITANIGLSEIEVYQ